MFDTDISLKLKYFNTVDRKTDEITWEYKQIRHCFTRQDDMETGNLKSIRTSRNCGKHSTRVNKQRQ